MKLSTQQEIVSLLLSLSGLGTEIREAKDQRAVNYPYCKGNRIRANGKLKGIQRYVCNGCKKNFSETTGKFWFALKKKDKINDYLYCLLLGYRAIVLEKARRKQVFLFKLLLIGDQITYRFF